MGISQKNNMSGTIDPKSRSMITASASSLVALYGAYWLLSSKRKQRTIVAAGDDNHSMSTMKSPPPMAKAGILETIKQLSGTNLPNFLLDTARDLQSEIFRLNLHYVFFCPMVVTVSDPKVSREILLDPLTTKPNQIYKPLDDMVGGKKNIFTSNGKDWHSRRKGMAIAFSSKHITRMNKVASKKVDEWINTRLSKFIDNNESFDVGHEMIDITLSAISETAFEYQISEKEKEDFIHNLEVSLKEFFFKTAVNPLRKPFGLFFSERRCAHLAAENLHSFCLKIINEYRQLENPIKDTIIDRIMKNSTYKDDSERAADIFVLLVAGHDTTGFSIAFTLKELAKNPKEQQNLRDSLDSLQKKNWNESIVLRKVIKEGMRLHPVADGATRTLGRDFTTDEGFLLPKGSIAILTHTSKFRNNDIFDDADSFIPGRWDYPTERMNEAFHPFSLGKRNCSGQALANAEIHSIIAQICSEFELELTNEGEKAYFLTNKPVNTMLKAKKIVRVSACVN